MLGQEMKHQMEYREEGLQNGYGLFDVGSQGINLVKGMDPAYQLRAVKSIPDDMAFLVYDSTVSITISQHRRHGKYTFVSDATINPKVPGAVLILSNNLSAHHNDGKPHTIRDELSTLVAYELLKENVGCELTFPEDEGRVIEMSAPVIDLGKPRFAVFNKAYAHFFTGMYDAEILPAIMPTTLDYAAKVASRAAKFIHMAVHDFPQFMERYKEAAQRLDDVARAPEVDRLADDFKDRAATEAWRSVQILSELVQSEIQKTDRQIFDLTRKGN
jgi:hypothetical protein